MANTIEFKLGDGATHYFELPVSLWSAGGKLFFTAKSVPDADASDGNAVINKTFTDLNVSVGSTYARYTCTFAPGDVNVSFSDGSKKKKYLGEFQFVPTTNIPQTYPGNDKYLEVVVYADIRRGIT